MYETGAPPPQDHAAPLIVDVLAPDTSDIAPARPARGGDAVTAIIPGPPPGTTTVRLRGTETTATE